MDPTGITNLATGMSNAKIEQSHGVAVLKKAIDLEAEGALQLLESIAPMPNSVSSTGGTAGQFINVKA